MSGVASKITQERAKAAGLGCINNPVKFSGQDYEKLKAQCLESKTKFEDPIFPAVQASLGKTKLGPDSDYVRGLEWKRPSEIQTNPVFIKQEAEREDVCQGSQDYLSHVVPEDQSFDKNNYVGIFHFKLWQYGEWVDVVVDDRLPTKDNKLIFAKSKTSNEFWSALLEKAYAKVNGSYEALLSDQVVKL